MRIFLEILLFILTLFSIVLMHEFGHFITARLFKIKVLKFSIGFGKAFYSFYDKRGTEYSLAILPLGGYVKLLDERETPVPVEQQHLSFNRRPIYQRFLVIAAGIIANLIFAIFAFWIVYMMGIVYIKPIIGKVAVHSLAAQASLKPGEEIVAIDNKPTPHWAAVNMALVAHYGEKGKLTFTVLDPKTKKHNNLTVTVDMQHWRFNALRPNPLQSFGITPQPIAKVSVQNTQQLAALKNKLNIMKFPPEQALYQAAQQTLNFFNFNFIIFYKMITGTISWQSLGGPFSIWQMAVQASEQGLVIYINFLALLSISVAVLNLLPIPGLDGAQLLYLIIEGIIRKPLSVAVQILLFRLGMIVILILFAQVLANDLLRLG